MVADASGKIKDVKQSEERHLPFLAFLLDINRLPPF
jgi:hypothetical protein